MAEILESARNSCALHGAINAAQEIEGVVPIIHSTSGCGLQQCLGNTTLIGGTTNIRGYTVPSSNVIEKQVIFGGTSRLREQIKNTVKVIKGELYVVLTGCTTELVGDDSPAMVKEAQEQGYPVIYIKVPGFKGKIDYGYETFLQEIIKELPKISNISLDKTKRLVNILGVIPNQDIFWRGNLEEIKRIFQAIGVKVNTIFGFGQDVEELKKLFSAELNIVISSWGQNTAKILNEKYNTPFISFDNIPIGSDETKKFINSIAEHLELDLDEANNYIKEEQSRFNYYLDSIKDIYFEYNLQKNFGIVGEASTVLGVSKFLVNYLAMIPKAIVITDNPLEEHRNHILEELSLLFDKETANIYFTEDRGKIEEVLEDSDIELILGSSLENKTAEKLELPFHNISFPADSNVILSKGYAGYKGAVTLLEDISSIIVKHEKEVSKEIEKDIKNINKVVCQVKQ